MWLGSVPAAAAVPLIVLSIVIFIGGAAVEGKLVLQTDPIKWVNQDSQVIKDLDTVQAEIGGSSEFGVFVRDTKGADLLADQTAVDYIDKFNKEQLARWKPSKGLIVGSSIVASISDLLVVPGASSVSPHAEDVRAAYEVAPADLKRATASPDGSAVNIIFLSGEQSLKGQKVIITGIRSDVKGDLAPPASIEAVPSGLAVVGVGLLDNLEANRILLTYLAVLFVFLFLTFRLRSVVRSLLSLVPVLIATGAASLRRVGVRPRAQPDDGGRWSARRGDLYRVHLVDPPALRGGTPPRSRPEGGDRSHCHSDRSRLHRLGLHRDLRRGGHRHVLAAVATRLRNDRGHERGRRPVVGAGRATPDAGVGRQPEAQLGVERSHAVS